MPALKESRVALSAAKQLPLIMWVAQTEEVVAARMIRRKLVAVPCEPA